MRVSAAATALFGEARNDTCVTVPDREAQIRRRHTQRIVELERRQSEARAHMGPLTW